jgi:hypothetical protein
MTPGSRMCSLRSLGLERWLELQLQVGQDRVRWAGYRGFCCCMVGRGVSVALLHLGDSRRAEGL